MKSAKEWAAETVSKTEYADIDVFNVDVGDGEVYVTIGARGPAENEMNTRDALSVVERLVERAQADARTPLEEEIARLRAENVRLKRVAIEAIAQAEGRHPLAVVVDIMKERS